MFTLRCTQKLLSRGFVASPGEHQPTTVLGDWYANIALSRPQHLILCVSEKSLLPLVIPAKDLKNLTARLREQLASVLATFGVPAQRIESELNAMHEYRVGRTTNKSILGSLNEFMFHLEHGLHSRPELSLTHRALKLADMPCKPLAYAFPSEVALALLSEPQRVAL
jgi:hypothetical protein